MQKTPRHPKLRGAMKNMVRLWPLPHVAVLLLALLQGTSLAQQPAADLPPEKARQFLELLSDPQVKAWLGAKIPAQTEAPDASAIETMSVWETAIRGRFAGLVNAIPRIPQEIANAAGIIARDINAGRPGLVAMILIVLIGVGYGAEWLVRRGFDRVRGTGQTAETDAGSDILRQFPLEIAALLAFSFVSVGAFLAFQWPPLLRKVVLTLLAGLIIFRLTRAVFDLLLAVDGPLVNDAVEPPVWLRRDEASISFSRRRISIGAGFFLFGWAIVGLMPALGYSAEVRQLAAYTFGLGILGTAIEAAWRRPHAEASSAVWKLLLTLYLVVLWLIWVSGMLGLLWLGIFTLVLPPIVRAVGRLASLIAGRYRLTGALGVTLEILIVRGARTLVIAAAIAWLAYIWRFSVLATFGAETATRLVNGLLHAVIVLLIANLLWQLLKALIEYRMNLAPADGSSADEVARSGRLRTLLPIFRNALAAFISGVAVLTILAGLGVQIAPLIAGAGIFGVAIGFGSQTLVKDVLSGVFYMMDDAFRVGEYIQSGSYKGTVESFSLRSVRLRHHRGPVYTVPFGQLGAIQNMSRDWAIEKLMINVTYDSDVDLARKLVKKIGQELAADPEFAADTLEPLKMQGIDNFGDYAIVLKMKLMTKPGTAFAIKRRALMMIKKAFDENGIKIAVPTVHVEGSGETAAAAHQANQTLKKKKAALEVVSDTPP